MTSRNDSRHRSFPALSPQVFQVLLSLSQAPQHGYAIILDIKERTGGEIQLTASTLYDAIARLADQQLIREVDAEPGAAAPRRSYALTKRGRDAVEAEMMRLERLLRTAKATLTPKKGGAR